MLAKYRKHLAQLRHRAKAGCQWIRFGHVTEKVMATVGDGVVSEIEYRGRGGKMVGYWAYGYFDPKLPYQG